MEESTLLQFFDTIVDFTKDYLIIAALVLAPSFQIYTTIKRKKSDDLNVNVWIALLLMSLIIIFQDFYETYRYPGESGIFSKMLSLNSLTILFFTLENATMIYLIIKNKKSLSSSHE